MERSGGRKESERVSWREHVRIGRGGDGWMDRGDEGW